MFAPGLSGFLDHVIESTKKDIETGRLPDGPRTWRSCHSWEDAWLYFFRRIDLDYTQFLRWQDKRITRVVLDGPDFGDWMLDPSRLVDPPAGKLAGAVLEKIERAVRHCLSL